MERLDVLVLGGGTAGCVLAGRLVPRANTNLTTAAIADRVAEWL